MTDIDLQADIEVQSAHEHVVARVPLAGQVSSEWIRCYHRLARATDVPVRAEAGPDRAWIVVSVSASVNQAEVAETMDAARTLITEADAATARAPATAYPRPLSGTGGTGGGAVTIAATNAKSRWCEPE